MNERDQELDNEDQELDNEFWKWYSTLDLEKEQVRGK
jgi:hypothetical protein